MAKRRSGSGRIQKPEAAPKPVGASTTTPAAAIDALTGDPNFMTSLGRGLAVIEAFSEQQRHLTIAQISQITGIPRASVRRCLHTLRMLGYVEAEGHSYSLRPRILTLGHAYLSSTPLVGLAQSVLDRVSSAVHESSSLAILDGDEILYLARSAASRVMSVALNAGTRLPAYCTSMGRVLLAALPEPELEAYLARVELKPLTEHTVTSADRLREIIQGVRRAGYAAVDQELEIGLRSIAVPVHDRSGAVVATINIGMHASRGTIAQMETEFLPQLQAAARDLRMLLPG